MILGILVFLSGITMFKDIDMKDYNLQFELQWSYFLYDCLFEEISFVLEDVEINEENNTCWFT